MEGIKKPHINKCKEIMNDWNYDNICTLTSLLSWDLENLEHLAFTVHSAHEIKVTKQ
jgi:hypothetical protein